MFNTKTPCIGMYIRMFFLFKQDSWGSWARVAPPPPRLGSALKIIFEKVDTVLHFEGIYGLGKRVEVMHS